MTESTSELAVHQDVIWVAGLSPAIQTIEGAIAEIARTNLPILLVGESGTGKEMFANRIYRLSQNANRPLTRIACASITPAMLLAELGLNPSDENGNGKTSAGLTVLFDEISDLDAACQRSLLAVLPDGDARTRKGTLRARVITTTSWNLEQEVRAGRFRSELYYRLNGIFLRLPALRERREDIPQLAEFFITKHAAQYGRTKPSLSSETVEMLTNHPWPGNIRELENVIKRILALGDEQLALSDLNAKPYMRKDAQPAANGHCSLKAAARAASRDAERELIMKALARTRWNRKRAAQELQISYKSLLYKLKQIGFEETEVN